MGITLRGRILLLILLITFQAVAQKEVYKKQLSKPMLAVKFSPDGKIIASICADKTIKLSNSADGSIIKTLNDNDAGDVTIAFSPDGKYLASGSWDKDVKIWDVNSGEIVKRLSGHTKAIRSVDYHPGGDFVVSTGWDHQIMIWHIETESCINNFKGHSQCIRAVKISPDGKQLASGGYDLMLKTWDFNSGKVQNSVKAHKYPIEAITYSADGKYIITGSADNLVKIWNSEDLSLVKTLNGHQKVVYSVEISPDNKWVASASNDATFKIWNLNTGEVKHSISGHTLSVKSVSFSPDGKRIASCSTDKTIRMWDISTMNIVPLQPTYNGLIKKVESSGVLTWINPIEKANDILERDYTLRIRVNDKSLTNYKLIVNNHEHIEYNGEEKYIVRPNIMTSDNDGQVELEYKVYLHDGDNEVVLFAYSSDGSKYTVSDGREIFCHDFSKLANNPDLYIHIINMPSYSDKKINPGYSPENTDLLVNSLKAQQGQLYKNVFVNRFETEDKCNNTTIEESFKDISQKIKENDVLFFFLNAQFMEGQDGDFYIMPSDITEKKEEVEAVLFDYIMNYISALKSYSVLIINAGNKLENSKKFHSPDPKKLTDYIDSKMEECDNYSILVVESNSTPIADKIGQCFDAKNNQDENVVIEYNHIEKFLKESSVVHSVHYGNAAPLVIHLNK